MDHSWMSKDRRSKDYADGSYHTWYWHGDAAPSGPPTSRAEWHHTVEFNDVDSTIEMVQVAYDDRTKKRKGVPAKLMWYFPPIPRFRRLFQSPKIAKDLIWHAQEREFDGKMRHPSDSPSWKLVDHRWPDFALEPRNLRLAISADGINPHSSMSSRHSCWLIIMVIYNLPPWLCMKRKFMMLSLLISGPRQPGNDIDVYLAPLLDDLKMLWDVGVECYDVHQQEVFTLRVVLLWTINDFPAYGNLSGCVVKGYFACLICGEDTFSHRLKHGKKNSYTGHIIFLPCNHPFRKQKKAFNGKQEFSSPPQPLSGEEILRKIDVISNSWGKNKNSRGKLNVNTTNCWKKKSIFFDLEYWKYLHVRLSLDVMHIEKNVCESVIGTLLNIPGKTKDGLNSRLDLLEMGLSKVVDVSALDKLQNDLVVTLCLLEKCFPPSFFDIMLHRTVHLAREVRLCGPVYLRWMYPFERFMKVLKGYVRNRNWPEGCIAECYIAEEAIEFCTEYLSNVDAIGIPISANIDQKVGAPIPRGQIEAAIGNNEPISETLKWIAHGPSHYVSKYHGYVINGCRYHTKERDDLRATQNSGVSIVASTMEIASAKDQNPVFGELCFYGIITEI
uniref:DUF4218 domain-containing protein n=1 Tax=Vitis vinifera TaxID=29760 RepID=A5B258_VITVI|nr:hypothetical protein VITISV_021512 [Vitis vinifera]